MNTHTIQKPYGNIPSGTKIWLTDDQAAARAHVLRAHKSAEREGRRLYVTTGQAGFKAGELVGIEGKLDRGLETLLGVAERGGSGRPAHTKVVTGLTSAAAAAATKAKAEREQATRLAKARAAADSARADLEAATERATAARQVAEAASEATREAAIKDMDAAEKALAKAIAAHDKAEAARAKLEG